LPLDEELRTALDFVHRQCQRLGVAVESVHANEQAWSDLAHVLFNAKEFIFVR
jgi:hypothetical protein